MPSWNCCVMNCKNNTHGPLRFFSFPKDDERRLLWAESCGRPDWYPTDLSRICEVHFDKSQFEQNQQDGKKLLKWSAIPRMYEEWTNNSSSATDENFQISYEYDRLDDKEEPYSDYKSSPGVEMESVGDDFAASEVEGLLGSEQKKTERLKRKRAASDDKLDSEEYQLHKKERNEISEAKRSRKRINVHEETEELEDELSRIKAGIRKLMECVDTEPTSDVHETSYETDGETAHISPISAVTSRRSNIKESKSSPGTVILSPPSPHKRYLQKANSVSLQPRLRSSQSNKTSGAKKSRKSSLLYSQLRKEEEISHESPSVPSVARTRTAQAKRQSTKQSQSIKGNRRTGSTISLPSQPPKNRIRSNLISDKVEKIRKQSLNVASRRNALLQEILSERQPVRKRDASDKPWRAPDDLAQIMNKAASGEKGTASKFVETPSRAKTRKRENINNTMSKSSNSSEGRAGVKDDSLRTGKVETNSLFKDLTKIKSTSPRIVKVQSASLLKDAAEINSTPLKGGIARSNNLSEVATRVNETASRIGNVQSRSSLKNTAVKKVVVPRIIKVQSTGEMQNSKADNKDRTSGTDVIQRNLLKKTIKTPLNTSDVQNKTALRETPENQTSSEVHDRNSEERNGSKTATNEANPPMSRSAHLKKLLASMLSLEEDMFSDEANLQMLKDCNENTNTEKTLEVGVQADVSQLEDVAGLKTEIAQLKQQLQEKNKLIQQLQQSLAAILPPGQIIMLESENDEKYVVFNQQSPS